MISYRNQMVSRSRALIKVLLVIVLSATSCGGDGTTLDPSRSNGAAAPSGSSGVSQTDPSPAAPPPAASAAPAAAAPVTSSGATEARSAACDAGDSLDARIDRVPVPPGQGITVIDALPAITCARVAIIDLVEYTGFSSADSALFLDDGRLFLSSTIGSPYRVDPLTGAGEELLVDSGEGAVRLSDGRVAMTASLLGGDEVWTIFDPETGAVTTGPQSLAIADPVALPDGGFAVLSGDIEVVAADGTMTAYPPPTNDINTGSAFPDGRLITGDREGVVRVHAASDFSRVEVELTGYDRAIRSVLALPDGRVAAGGSGGAVLVWDLDTPDDPERWLGHEDSVIDLALLPDGRLVSASRDRSTRAWDPATGENQVLGWHGSDILSLDVGPTGLVATAALNDITQVWDPAALAPTDALLEDPFREAKVLPDGRVVTGAAAFEGRVWSVGEDTAGFSALDGHDNYIRDLAVMADGTIVTGAKDGIIAWDVDAPEDYDLITNRSTFRMAALTDGRVAIVDFDDTVGVVDLATGEILELGSHDDTALDIVGLADGRVASVGFDDTLRIWDPSDPAAAPETHAVEYATSVAASSDGTVVVGTFNASVFVVRPGGTPEEILFRPSGRGDIDSVAVLRDDLWLAADPLLNLLYVIEDGVTRELEIYGITRVEAIDEQTFLASTGAGWFIATIN